MSSDARMRLCDWWNFQSHTCPHCDTKPTSFRNKIENSRSEQGMMMMMMSTKEPLRYTTILILTASYLTYCSIRRTSAKAEQTPGKQSTSHTTSLVLPTCRPWAPTLTPSWPSRSSIQNRKSNAAAHARTRRPASIRIGIDPPPHPCCWHPPPQASSCS